MFCHLTGQCHLANECGYCQVFDTHWEEPAQPVNPSFEYEIDAAKLQTLATQFGEVQRDFAFAAPHAWSMHSSGVSRVAIVTSEHRGGLGDPQRPDQIGRKYTMAAPDGEAYVALQGDGSGIEQGITLYCDKSITVRFQAAGRLAFTSSALHPGAEQGGLVVYMDDVVVKKFRPLPGRFDEVRFTYRPTCDATEHRWLSHHGESSTERRVVRMRIENDSPDTARLSRRTQGLS